MIKLYLASILALASAGAMAFAPASVAVVNGTGGTISNLEIRDAAGGSWTSLAGSAANGGRVTWSFDDQICAYDVRATIGGDRQITVRGVNPCDAKLLTLRRNAETGWVDYD